MSINLLDMLKDQVTGQLAKGAAGFLGESESTITSALGDGIFPALLGSMIDKGSSQDGAVGLMNTLKDFDGGMLDNIGGLFGGGSDAVSGLMNSGSGILSMLLGNQMGTIVDAVSKMAGIKGSTTTSLLKMAAPMIMSMVGGYVKKNGLSVSGFMDLLSGQKSHVEAAGPSDWNPLSLASGLLGGAKDMAEDVMDAAKNVGGAAMDVAGDAMDSAKDVGGAAVKTGGSMLRWLLPLLLLLMFLGYFFGFRTGCNAVDSTVDKANDMTEQTVSAVGDAAGDVAGSAMEMATKAFSTIDAAGKAILDKVTFATGSAGEQMMSYVKGGFKGNGIFIFNNLTFATGSANIDATTAVEVDNLAKILAAYPNVQVDIEGYTDNTGDSTANIELSKARASAVKGRLIAQGIDPGRIGTAGLGSANPVADNNTEEGRAKNRRIEVRIAQ